MGKSKLSRRQSKTADSAPGVATWDVTLSTKSSPKHPLACNWYYCAQFIAKPKAVCALFQLGGDVKQPWLMSKYDIIHKTGST